LDRGRRRALIFFWATVILSLGLGVLIYLEPGWWNHNSEYRWQVLWHGRKEMALWVFSGLSAVVVLSYVIWENFLSQLAGRSRDFSAGVLILLAGILSPVVLAQVDRYGSYELLIRVLVADHTGYFTDAQRFGSREELVRTYLENWGSLQTHSRTHPPGVILVFMGLNRVAERSEGVQRVCQYLVGADAERGLKEHFQVDPAGQAGGMLALALMLISGAMSAVLGYYLLRRFYSAELSFISSLVLVSLPAFSHQAPMMDQVFAVLILGSALIALGGMGKLFRVGIWRMLPAGIVVGAGLWLSPGVWSALILIPLLSAAEMKTRQPDLTVIQILKKLAPAELIIIAGIIFGLWLGSLLAGASWLEIYRVNRLGWDFNNTISGRLSPWKWMIFNPYEFLFWCSLPVFLGVLVKIWLEVKSGGFSGKIDFFFWFSGAFFIILNFSGQICYESPRLCWFCLPLISGMSATGLITAMKKLHRLILIAFLELIIFQTVLLRLIY